MTTYQPTSFRAALRWHRPLMLVAAFTAVFIVVSALGLAFDHRVLVGVPIWLKPFKFAVSITIYAVTWAWMLTLLRRGRRLAGVVSTIVAVAIWLEYVVIVLQTIRGQESHFNVTTSFNNNLYDLMGTTIVVLWIGNLVLAVLMFLRGNGIGDRASTLAMRLGAVLSLIGMGLGFLMVIPTAAQRMSMHNGTFAGIVGAHSVGVPDGGPVIPIIGWSATGGDLRIPHFVGLHALQAIPLVALLLVVLGRRWAALRSNRTRFGLVVVAASGYAGLLGLVTWQALRGQSLIHPDRLTLAALAALIVGTAVAATWVLTANRNRSTEPTETEPTETDSTETGPTPTGPTDTRSLEQVR